MSEHPPTTAARATATLFRSDRRRRIDALIDFFGDRCDVRSDATVLVLPEEADHE